MSAQADRPAGGRFRDAEGRDRGWASVVSLRPGGLSSLTVLDVTTEDSGLATFLRTLDSSPLYVDDGGGGVRYSFTWASGYENDGRFRVQGIVAGSADGRPRSHRPRRE